MAVGTTLSTRRRRVHPRTAEVVAVLSLTLAVWGPVALWAVGA